MRIKRDDRGNFCYDSEGAEISQELCEICGGPGLWSNYIQLMEKLKPFLTDDMLVCCDCWKLLQKNHLHITGTGKKILVGDKLLLAVQFIGHPAYDFLQRKLCQKFNSNTLNILVPATKENVRYIMNAWTWALEKT